MKPSRERLARALEQVRALVADGPETWEGYETRDIGHAFLAESVLDWVADLRAALALVDPAPGEPDPECADDCPVCAPVGEETR